MKYSCGVNWTGAIEIWGFSPDLTTNDTNLIQALLLPVGTRPVILAVNAARDLLQDWRQTASLTPSLQMDGISYVHDWFLMLTGRESGEFYNRLKVAWSVYYAAELHIVSADSFWLGYWFRKLSSAGVFQWRESRKQAAVRAAFLIDCEIAADGECLLLHTWCGEIARRSRREIETLVTKFG